ncbi:MAG TPA: transposase [Rhodopseudomonas sp.]|uniref:transposase n=1 Tax=Rhodopseudomonas sp. TaxID=1078 RepID=UPI002ED98D6F
MTSSEPIDARRSRRCRAAAVALLLVGLGAGLSLGGCSIPVSDMPLLGASDDKDKDSNGYLAVNALPAGREEKALEPGERTKLEGELIAARERQTAAAAAAATAGSVTANAAPAIAK